MRRDKRPFTVEVRRGGNKTPAAPKTKSRPAAKKIQPPVEMAPPTAAELPPPALEANKPVGRILPSLVEPEPVELMAEPDLPRRRGRPPGSKNKPKPGRESSGLPIAAKRRGRPPKVRVSAPTVYEWAASANEPEIVAPVRQAEPVVRAIAEPRQAPHERRVSKILARYVFGTMAKPGERWKRSRRAI